MTMPRALRTHHLSRTVRCGAVPLLCIVASCAPAARTEQSLSCAHEIHDNATAAIKALTAQAAANTSSKEPQLCLAYAFIATKQYPAAVEAASRALALDSTDALALRMRAFARYRLGAFASAIEDATKSLQWQTSGEAYEILGKCRLRTGDAAGAAEDFRIWAQLDKSIEARCWMGSALWTSGDTAGALSAWLAAERDAPLDPEPLVWKCGFLFRAGDSKGALSAAERAVELAPDSPQTLGALARVQSWAGDASAAQATVAKLAVTNAPAAQKLAKQLKQPAPTAKGT